MKAQKKLYNTARPGTPEFEKALAQRNTALKDYLKSRAITNNKILKPLPDPQGRRSALQGPQDRPRPVTKGSRTSRARRSRPTPPPAARSSPARARRSSATWASSARASASPVRRSASTTTSTRTAPPRASPRPPSAPRPRTAPAPRSPPAAPRSASPPPASAASVCAGVAFGGSYLAGKYGTQFGGWAYDRGADAVNAVNDHVVKPVVRLHEGRRRQGGRRGREGLGWREEGDRGPQPLRLAWPR